MGRGFVTMAVVGRRSSAGRDVTYRLEGTLRADSSKVAETLVGQVGGGDSAFSMILEPRGEGRLSVVIPAMPPFMSMRGPAYLMFERDDAASNPSEEMPLFPWPPPKASSRMLLPNGLVTTGAPEESLGIAFDRVRAALLRGKFPEYALYALPGFEGFAVVTRLENIDERGHPLADRFSVEEPRPDRPRSLGEYLAALFNAPPGRYRVIALMVTNEPVVETELEPKAGDADRWLRQGLRYMPSWLRSRRLGPDNHCEALIYEFVNQ